MGKNIDARTARLKLIPSLAALSFMNSSELIKFFEKSKIVKYENPIYVPSPEEIRSAVKGRFPGDFVANYAISEKLMELIQKHLFLHYKRIS